MPNVEWSINVGTIGTVLTLFFSIAGFYWVTKSDMKALKENVVAIKDELRALTKVTADLAVQHTRLDNQEKLLVTQGEMIATLDDRLYKLSQGRGFIRQAVDGEYPR